MAKSDKGTILYVGGLHESVKKEEIEKEFERFGKLNRVWVAFNPPGFAFVEYEDKDDAEKAVNAMHSAMVFGGRLRVEISRGRGGGRGGSRDGFSSRGRGGFRGGRGDFGSRGSFGGRGSRGGRGGFNRGSPYDRDESVKPFRRGDMGGRFDDFADRRGSDFGPIRDYSDRGFGAARDFRDDDLPRGFGAGRDVGASRDYGSRDFPPARDIPSRDFARRDYETERPVNGAARAYGADPLDRGFNGRDMGGGRDFGGAGQTSLGARGFGSSPTARRESGGFMEAREYGADREIVGMRRETVRDFNPPRDLGNARDFGARPARVTDYADDRYGAAGMGGGVAGAGAGYSSARYGGADIPPADYGGYGARDRFRSRSPIGRGSHPMY